MGRKSSSSCEETSELEQMRALVLAGDGFPAARTRFFVGIEPAGQAQPIWPVVNPTRWFVRGVPTSTGRGGD